MHNAFPAAIAVRLICDQLSDNVALQPPHYRRDDVDSSPGFWWMEYDKGSVLCAWAVSPAHTSYQVLNLLLHGYIHFSCILILYNKEPSEGALLINFMDL